MSNPWVVSEAEYAKNVQLFGQLTNGQRLMDATTARNTLLRSNLPNPMLSQIWQLSDVDKDGHLDIREYSIAMRLALNCLAGIPLPPVLPPSLLIVPAQGLPPSIPSTPTHGALPTYPPPPAANTWSRRQSMESPMHHQQFPVYHTAPPGSGPRSRTNSVTGSPTDRGPFEGKQCENWVVPHNNKLKYSQTFNQLDKQRMNFLNAQAARSALGLSGLSTPVLAHIWFLSDVNRDGKLSVEEYCISQHFIEMFKAGFALPTATPPELVHMCGLGRSENNTPELEPGALPAQKTPAPKTFEDKRMDNFAKGQAELERRRQILMEEENARRAERERKEREEEARRERERAEKERQMELERQAEFERQKILEAAREEEEKKRKIEMERRREEEEKQKQAAMEKARIKQMQTQKQQESERVAQRQQREKTLQFQLQALDEKSVDSDADIVKARDLIAGITGEIEGMREKRDEKVAAIQKAQQENQKLSIESQELAHKLLQMQSANQETTTRKAELESLKLRRDALKQALELARARAEEEEQKARRQVDQHVQELDSYKENVYSGLVSNREEYRKTFELLQHAQKQAQTKLAEKAVSMKTSTSSNSVKSIKQSVDSFQNGTSNGFATFDTNFGSSQGFGAAPAPPNPVIPMSESRNSVSSTTQFGGAHETSKCRALFAFEARSEDELSFEPGDVIIVFQGHAAEPGWRAGQLREKVGWFPEAFVESIAAVPTNVSEPPIQNMPPNVTPSCSLDRIPEEAVKQQRSEDSSTTAVIGMSMADEARPTICLCIAQFQWRARNEGDLSFAKGDPIEVIEQQDMKWKGRKSTGEVGWFPKSYVKVLPKDGSATTPLSDHSPTKAFSSAQYDVVPGSDAAQDNDEWYTAAFDFDPQESTDLGLKVGDRVQVIEKNDAWWKGRCNGKEGMFPMNYVERAAPTSATTPQTPSAAPTTNGGGHPPATNGTGHHHARAIVDFAATAANQLTIKAGDLILIREKSATGWWEGEISRDGAKFCGWFPGEYVKETDEPSVAIPSATPTALALYDYEAQQADELNFSVGDLIAITDKSDVEWWSGYPVKDANKTPKLFPANYVVLQ